jgi:transcriptional regulator with XRE-family HTH domain
MALSKDRGHWPYGESGDDKMVPKLVRTPEELKAARHALGLSADGLARMVRVEDGRTVRRWEAGEREIPGPVIVLLETAMSYLAKKELIASQLEMLRSGKMRMGRSEGSAMVDDTKETIARLSEARASYESALETLTVLTRQPAVGEVSDRVHWYDLKRLNPLFNPPQKDEWSVPGELSAEAALAYFQKHEGFAEGLELCGDLDAEFILQWRQLLRTPSPSRASHRLRAGDIVGEAYVRRKGSQQTGTRE